jgi:hypothetical protein
LPLGRPSPPLPCLQVCKATLSGSVIRVLFVFRGCSGLLRFTFFSSAAYFLAKLFQLHALRSRKNGGVVTAPKEVLHEL